MKRTALVAVVGLLVGAAWVACLTGCEGGGTDTPVLTSLSISPTHVNLQVGQSRQIRVTGYDQNRDGIGFTAAWSMEGSAGAITPGGEVGAVTA